MFYVWRDGRVMGVNMDTGVVRFGPGEDQAKFKTDVIPLAPGSKEFRSGEPAPYSHGLLDPEQVLRKSRELIESFRFPSSLELTVGDVSIPAEDKRKNRARDAKRFLRNMEQGLSIGDLTDKEDNKTKLDKMLVGRPRVEPAMTESAQIDAERVREHQRQVDEVLHIRNLLAGGKDEWLERYIDKYVRRTGKEPRQEN
jgi:hypothetical protein